MMNKYSCDGRNVFILVITCLLLIGPVRSEARTRRAVDDAFGQSAKDSARLVIRRIPNLGRYLIVDLRIDGVAAGSIAYGHNYETFLTPGRHVLSVRPTPLARWGSPTEMILNARSDQTYSFTAMGDHSGYLILKGGQTFSY